MTNPSMLFIWVWLNTLSSEPILLNILQVKKKKGDKESNSLETFLFLQNTLQYT